MIVEFIFAAICGIIVSYILVKFLIRLQKRKRENPKLILEKLEKADKKFYLDGKEIDLVDELKKSLTAPSPLPKDKKKAIKPEQTEIIVSNVDRQPGKASLNKMLGKR